MPPSSKRRFGGPSRSANTHPYKKSEGKLVQHLKENRLSESPEIDASEATGSPNSLLSVCATGLATFESPTASATITCGPHFKLEPHDFQEAVVRAFASENKPHQESSISPVPGGDNTDKPGMPTRAEWTALMDKYLGHLHPSKRDKALISESMHKMIYQTLIEPDIYRVGTPQFRFWCRKMFQVVDANGVLVLTNGGRPIAVKEYIYDILCMCHEESGHSGRDKTCKILRDYYTWIPKELTASFVKACPTCSIKRSTETLASRKARQTLANSTAMHLDFYGVQQLPAGSPCFSVQTVDDFNKPTPPAQQLYISSQPSELAANTKDVSHEHNTSLSSPLGSTLSSRLYLPERPTTEASRAFVYTLPPIEKDKSGQYVNSESGPMDQPQSLPPLMQYLSSSTSGEGHSKATPPTNQSESASAPFHLDPALLAESRRSTQPALYPGLIASASTSSDISGMSGEFALRERRSEGDHMQDSEQAKVDDRSPSPGSVEGKDADTTLCDDRAASIYKVKKSPSSNSSASDAPLHSPVPFKVEDTSAMALLVNASIHDTL